MLASQSMALGKCKFVEVWWTTSFWTVIQQDPPTISVLNFSQGGIEKFLKSFQLDSLKPTQVKSEHPGLLLDINGKNMRIIIPLLKQ